MNAVLRYKFSIIYFLAIVAVNVAWSWYGEYLLWPTPWPGISWAPLAMIVGLWFVLRDYAQMELGNKVVLVMLGGMLVTFLLAGPQIAVASCTAFIIGEVCDWIVFSKVKGSFAKRMIISSLVAAPIDTIIFFAVSDMMVVVPGAKMLSLPTVLTEVTSKLFAAYIVYLRIKNRTTVINEHVVA